MGYPPYGIEDSAHHAMHQNNFRIQCLLPYFFPVTFFIRNMINSCFWSLTAAASDGRKLGWRGKLSLLFQESRFTKMQTHPQNCCINTGESLGARKYGFVIEVVTEQQPNYSSLKKSVLERFYSVKLTWPKVWLKTCSSTWIFSPWKVCCPLRQTSTFKHPHGIKMIVLHIGMVGSAHSQYSPSRVNIPTQGSLVNSKMF